jgi:hypothetical protein
VTLKKLLTCLKRSSLVIDPLNKPRESRLRSTWMNLKTETTTLDAT